MQRVLTPLTRMGAGIRYEGEQGCAPFLVDGGTLKGATFKLAVASAQVQTALLLAGLQASGETRVVVPDRIRDHTQRMFTALGVPHDDEGNGSIRVSRLSKPIAPFDFRAPGDISSAAFFMVAAAIIPGSEVVIEGVGVNPGRRLVIDVLRRMGADVEEFNPRLECGEPVADLRARYAGKLRGVIVSAGEIAAGIDEAPILALAGAMAEGLFRVKGASELRVKESDRIKAIAANLSAAGADLKEFPDGFEIVGSGRLPGDSEWKTCNDHRMAMTGLVAALAAERPIAIDDTSCARISYPSFERDLQALLV